MKKMIFIGMTVIILLLNLSFQVECNDIPEKVFFGLDYGKIVSIDLESWDVEEYDTRRLEHSGADYLYTYDIRYFSHLNKIVFVAGSIHFEVGVIDLNTGEVYYPWPDIDGLGEKMTNYRIRTNREEEVYFSFADKAAGKVGEDEVDEYFVELVSYDVANDEWNFIDIKHCSETIEFYQNVHPEVDSYVYEKKGLYKILVEEKILSEEEEPDDILISLEGTKKVEFYGNYFLVRRNDRLALIKVISEDEFEVVRESPEDFLVEHSELREPGAITYKNELGIN